MPSAEFVEILIPTPTMDTTRFIASNTEKLHVWRDYMETATEPVIFADCDMLACGDASSAFNQPFDVAITTMTQPTRWKYNGGIVFARPTEKARVFFHEWARVNDKMVADPEFHEPYRIKYAGINQAALGWMLENGWSHKELPCRKYNACAKDWPDIDSETVFIHVKDLLKNMVLAGKPPHGRLERAMKEWYANSNLLL